MDRDNTISNAKIVDGTIEIKCYCDECGGVMNSEDEIFCARCFSSLQDEILELQSELGKTEAERRDLEAELLDIKRGVK